MIPLLLRRRFVTCWVLALCTQPVSAQEEPPPVVRPSGVAHVVLAGSPPTTLPFTLGPQERPLFSLPVLAKLLGVELRVGPLGNSYRLILQDKEVIVGPDRALMVIIVPDGSRDERFSPAPLKAPDGLRVPLDFLERTLGDELDIDFHWDRENIRLELKRREVRELEVSVDVVHQHFSTVEIRFSEVPRYRVEREPGALEIHLAGDRIKLPPAGSHTTSPLVRRIVVGGEGLRIELAENAGVAEPRLLRDPVRLIVEVFVQATAPAPETMTAAPADRPGLHMIVVDPGHGGSETGAVGPAGTAEKDLTVLVSRALKRLLERRLPVEVVLTRTEDVELPLDTRTAIANQHQADLFISIHFNSSFGRKAQGAETYFLNREASDQQAAAAAAAENYPEGTSNPESDLQLILWDLAQSYHLAESQRFANLVQEELNLALGLRDRGVKQAPFRVLMGSQMPAVLVELGFLNDPDEEAKLNSPVYRAELVKVLWRAIDRYKTQLEAREKLEAAEDLP